MSLKIFHLVFVTLSIAVSLFVGGWGIWASRAEGQPNFLLIGFFGFLGAIWLAYYGVRAFEKLFRQGGKHV